MGPHWRDHGVFQKREGWKEDRVEEADGESEMLLCEGWIAQGGVEGKWEKREKGNKMVKNVSSQSEGTVTVMQTLDESVVECMCMCID